MEKDDYNCLYGTDNAEEFGVCQTTKDEEFLSMSSHKSTDQIAEISLNDSTAKYPSLAQECRETEFDYELIHGRLRKGWTKDEAFERIECIDHEGNSFSSYKEMCAFWGADYGRFCKRVKNGWTLEAALGEPSQNGISDHLGNIYPSLNQMAKAYGIDSSTLRNRLKTGLPLERALLDPVRSSTVFFVYDHEGTCFNNISEMCSYWGIPRSAYDQRRRAGWTKEQILTTPMHRPECVQDHLGNNYQSFRAMCSAYGLDHATVKSRLKRGFSLKEALETPPIRVVFRTHMTGPENN